MTENEYPELDAYRARLSSGFVTALRNGVSPLVRRTGRRAYNPVTGIDYRGSAALSLVMQNFNDPRWVTRDQAISQDWILRDEETGTVIEIRDQSSRTALLTLFNAEQFDMVPPLQYEGIYSNEQSERNAHLLLRSSGASIFHSRDTAAYYSPVRDEIHLSLREQFVDASDYYGTALLELSHWTSHPSRMNRMFGAVGDADNVAEDLRAHIANWMLSEELGIPIVTPSHESMAAWIELLTQDSGVLISLFRDAAEINRFLLHIDELESNDAALSLGAQALHAQSITERIADAKEPSGRIIQDANKYVETYVGANDSLSRIIQRVAEANDNWLDIRTAAKNHMAEQENAATINLASEQSREAEDTKERAVGNKPFLVKRQDQGSALDQVIIRGNSGKDAELLHDSPSQPVSVNAPLTIKRADAMLREHLLNAVIIGSAGSIHLLNDLVLPVNSPREVALTVNELLEQEEVKPLQERKRITSRSLGSPER
jgi:antirestriction protein ArdC